MYTGILLFMVWSNIVGDINLLNSSNIFQNLVILNKNLIFGWIQVNMLFETKVRLMTETKDNNQDLT